MALEELCRTYWSPLYAFVRRSGLSPHAAQDVVQGFLARLLEREDLAQVDPLRGRFRSYLLAGLRHFLVSENRRENAQKRGGGAPLIPLVPAASEAEELPLATLELSPDEAYDRRWAETLIDRALVALKGEHEARGKLEFFETLKPALAGELSEDQTAVGARLGLTPGAVAVALHRLRLRFRELVRREVAQTVNTPEELEDELRNLQAIMSR